MARRAIGLLTLFLAAGSAPALGQLRLVQVPVRSRAGIDSLARLGFEVADLRPRAGGGMVAVIVVSPETQGALLLHGYVVEPVAGAAPPPGLRLLAADTFQFFRSFDKPTVGIRATLEAWAAADTLIHVDSIGASIEGRPILAVKIGAPGDDPARPNVLFMATHHAREWVSTEMAMRLIRWLADSLPMNLVTSRDIWVIPVANPDGYQYTFTTDRLWRKNRRPNANGSYGVDLNRNYPGFWGLDETGSSSIPAAETYRGTAPASEPETQAIVAFHAAHPPVVSVSYHTYSDLVLYPYGFQAGRLPSDDPFLEALAGTDLLPAVPDSVPGSLRTAYHPGPGWTLYPTNGEYTDWAYRAHGTLAFTPELTSGCCTPDSLYYGFDFPDDSAWLERVFRDNLPFARSLIVAAGDPTSATGVSGVAPTPPRIESVWPEVRVDVPRQDPAPGALTVRTLSGSVVTRNLQTDSLQRGVARVRWRSDVSIDQARAIRVERTGLEAALVTLAGAEPQDTGWTGWTKSPVALAGTASWAATSPVADTLTSPSTDLRGKRRIWLQFWTSRSSLSFAADQVGRVQASIDGGATWTDVYALEGDGPAWYPIRVDLPQAANVAAARVRFIAPGGGFQWWVDAVGFASDSAGTFVSSAPVADMAVSDNPVRGASVTISWPASAGAPRLSIYSFVGERLFSETLAPGTPAYVWDLTHAGGSRRVGNGAYLVIVELDGRVYRKRLFVAR